MAAKILGLSFFIIWLRATYPRLREDQLQRFSWIGLIPLALLNLMITAVLKVAAEKSGWDEAPAKREDRRSGRGLACNIYHGSTLIAQVADVSVGPKGDVRVHRVVTAVDCVQVVNLSHVEGQVESGVIRWRNYAAITNNSSP